MSIPKTILKNTFSNWAGILVNTLVMVLLTPYMLIKLGDERYGIYQTVFSIIHYMVLLEFGLRGSVIRFSCKYITAKDSENLNSVASTTFFFCLLISVVVMLASFIVGVFSVSFFNIDSAYRIETIYLVLSLGAATTISFLNYSFSGVIIGRNRFELQNIGVIIQNIGLAVLILVFFSLKWVSLSSWALAIILSSLFGLIFFIWIAFLLQKDLAIKLRYVNLATIKEMFGFGAWNMVLQFSSLIILSYNPIIIGKYMGMEFVPYYAIPMMLVNRLQTLAMGLSSTLSPYAASTLTTGDTKLFSNLLIKGTYISASLVFPLGGILFVMCKSLFAIWLPSGYENSWIIYGILMAAFLGSITQSVSSSVLMGGGKIKGMAIAYLISAISAIALGILFVGYLGWGLIGAALSLAICRFVSACIFQPLYTTSQLKLNVFSYLWQSYSRPFLCTLPSIMMAFALIKFLPPKNLFMWVIEYLVSLLPFGIFVLTGILDWPLRTQVMARMRCLLKKRKPA